MSQRKKSREERFLEKVYELASEKGEPDSEVDRYEVGKLVGANPKATDNSVQMLAKNGLLKRGEGDKVYLSDTGLRFVQDL